MKHNQSYISPFTSKTHLPRSLVHCNSKREERKYYQIMLCNVTLALKERKGYWFTLINFHFLKVICNFILISNKACLNRIFASVAFFIHVRCCFRMSIVPSCLVIVFYLWYFRTVDSWASCRYQLTRMITKACLKSILLKSCMHKVGHRFLK